MEFVWTEDLRVFPGRIIRDRRKRGAFPDRGWEMGKMGDV